MILRRLASAIRHQNWFQVVIEILIVIIGIFLGLQVQGWYEARGDRELEAKYLAQVYDEVVDIEDRFKGSLPRVEARKDILQGILDVYRKDEALNDFNHAQCNAIMVSHIYVNFVPTLTTISELETTGRSQVIESDEIKKLIVLHKSHETFSDKFISNLKSDGINFVDKFPEFMNVNIPVTTSSGFPLEADLGNSCEVPTDDKEVDFKNGLVFNTGRYTSYFSALKRQFDSLDNLRRALEEELGITNGEDAP